MKHRRVNRRLNLACLTAILLAGGCSSMPAPRSTAEPSDLQQEQLGAGVYRHEGNALLIGGGPDASAKFQISLKLRLADRVFLGYTQSNLWDISQTSAPFRDTTHQPSLFYYTRASSLGSSTSVRTAWGFEHQSNGRDEADSRSVNLLFARPRMTIGPVHARHWQLEPKLHAYLGKGDENPDIADYRTHLELQVANLHDDGLGVALWWRPGKSGRGSGAVTMSLPLEKLSWSVPGFLAVQVFAGYGETLLDYNRRAGPQLRIGYMLDRGS